MKIIEATSIDHDKLYSLDSSGLTLVYFEPDNTQGWLRNRVRIGGFSTYADWAATAFAVNAITGSPVEIKVSRRFTSDPWKFFFGTQRTLYDVTDKTVSSLELRLKQEEENLLALAEVKAILNSVVCRSIVSKEKESLITTMKGLEFTKKS